LLQRAQERQRFVSGSVKLTGRREADPPGGYGRFLRGRVGTLNAPGAREVHRFHRKNGRDEFELCIGFAAAAVCQGIEFREELVHAGRVGGKAVPCAGDQIGQHVPRAQQDMHDILGDLHLAAAHFIENGLEEMREGDKLIETESARTSLDRMHGAEHRMHCFDIAIGRSRGRKIRHGTQALTETVQQILAFLEEGDAQLVETGHVRPPTRDL
jgi:hypothetical protein